MSVLVLLCFTNRNLLRPAPSSSSKLDPSARWKLLRGSVSGEPHRNFYRVADRGSVVADTGDDPPSSVSLNLSRRSPCSPAFFDSRLATLFPL